MGEIRLNSVSLPKYVSHWTKICKQCYGINCICENCSYIPDDLKESCLVKNYVLLSYAKFGKPGKDEEEC